jgi:hypothetical protein
VAGTLDERAAIMLLLLIERCVAAAGQYVMAARILNQQPVVCFVAVKAPVFGSTFNMHS